MMICPPVVSHSPYLTSIPHQWLPLYVNDPVAPNRGLWTGRLLPLCVCVCSCQTHTQFDVVHQRAQNVHSRCTDML